MSNNGAGFAATTAAVVEVFETQHLRDHHLKSTIQVSGHIKQQNLPRTAVRDDQNIELEELTSSSRYLRQWHVHRSW
jgi:hypothetical protein